jgi:hypothetical protein
MGIGSLLYFFRPTGALVSLLLLHWFSQASLVIIFILQAGGPTDSLSLPTNNKDTEEFGSKQSLNM